MSAELPVEVCEIRKAAFIHGLSDCFVTLCTQSSISIDSINPPLVFCRMLNMGRGRAEFAALRLAAKHRQNFEQGEQAFGTCFVPQPR